MRAPNATNVEAVHPPTETPLPDCEASIQQIRDWIRAWHGDHGVEIDEFTLIEVIWTGQWIHEQPPGQLECDIISWGVPQREARMMVLDLVRERRHQKKYKRVRYLEQGLSRIKADKGCRSPGQIRYRGLQRCIR
jgi:hypothetical protein